MQELKRINEWLCQDLNKRLSKWFASRLDAKIVVRSLRKTDEPVSKACFMQPLRKL